MEIDIPGNDVELDDLDREIIRAYWLNPRAANVALARQLRVSEATIRRRLKALLDADVLQFSVVLGPSVTAGYLEFQMGVNAKGDLVEQVAAEIAAIGRARYVAIASGGRYDVLVAASANSMEEWLAFRAVVAAIEGVQRTETLPIAKVLKRATTDFSPDDIVGARLDDDIDADELEAL